MQGRTKCFRPLASWKAWTRVTDGARNQVDGESGNTRQDHTGAVNRATSTVWPQSVHINEGSSTSAQSSSEGWTTGLGAAPPEPVRYKRTDAVGESGAMAFSQQPGATLPAPAGT